ncbi:NAD(P)(+) transhydrogenase (Re/Si-specific) subunit beta [Acetobacter vaccinii]|uniref:NAD(P) transhydrogenase subunit beta n=1 Tax=Acetobacter vaccinii TaxID=2592655 RepID=A0A5C1YKQ4_9PROT|nr:NAD(P)(+) transhydrogenase (Re/Si-specific) subunit beta [Acetobacter vaccinii]QEO16854.1 NAD(P)(+) transhydrogenase (Re/Si-specific) subunit beta [Acetobacter vaccinii]
MVSEYCTGLGGIVAAGLFIYGLKAMSSPVTAVSGIVAAGYGMLCVVVLTFLNLFHTTPEAQAHLPANIALALLALALGCAWAGWRGRTVQMTAMPQMVAIFNGMGGGSAACLAAVALLGGRAASPLHLGVTMIGALIGCISLSGSLIAWAKLDGRLNKPLRFGGQRVFNAGLFLVTLALGTLAVLQYGTPLAGAPSTLFFLAALLFGVCMTLPIGGADMPVVISLYNAFTGLAVGLEGYVMDNPALMIAGMVVGSAGALLTALMAKAMNRSLTNVLFSNFGDISATADGPQGTMKSAEASDAATNMRYAASVIIVPGYGLAVAQAQQKLYEFVKILVAAGVDVKFAIHPVAGRMPGHMNVLLAEAGVPYDMIYDMDDINDSFASTDVALIIGANDVVNPQALTDKTSPIYGMPILNAYKARQVFVIKRGAGTGYAGVQNPLFFEENCTMVFGDAQAVLSKMVEAAKALATA